MPNKHETPGTTLRIHTTMKPTYEPIDTKTDARAKSPWARLGIGTRTRAPFKRPSQKLRIRRSRAGAGAPRANTPRGNASNANAPREKKPLIVRLQRDAAIACGLLLVVVALNALQLPVAQTVSNAVKGAVRMDLNLDETLGKLEFVRNLVPETALVFFDASAGRAFGQPAQGTVAHAYDAAQPWLEFQCDTLAVRSAQRGKVTAVKQDELGDWVLRVSHSDGIDSVYAYMEKVGVKVGDNVGKGDLLGEVHSGDGKQRLYFEVRKDGSPVDPSPYFSGKQS